MTLLQQIALFLFGALVTHVWGKYRNRPKAVRWSASYWKVAVAAAHPQFGTVEVSYNGTQVKNVHTGWIEVENESNADLQEVVVNMACLEQSRILVSTASLGGSLQTIPFTDSFWAALSNPQPPDIQYLTTHRDYRIPVFNRGAKATFVLLLNRDDAAQPMVDVSCDHLGVQFRRRPPTVIFLGVPQEHARWTGIVLTLIGSIFLCVSLTSAWAIGLSSWALGILCLLFGALLVKLWRWIGKQLS